MGAGVGAGVPTGPDDGEGEASGADDGEGDPSDEGDEEGEPSDEGDGEGPIALTTLPPRTLATTTRPATRTAPVVLFERPGLPRPDGVNV